MRLLTKPIERHTVVNIQVSQQMESHSQVRVLRNKPAPFRKKEKKSRAEKPFSRLMA